MVVRYLVSVFVGWMDGRTGVWFVGLTVGWMVGQMVSGSFVCWMVGMLIPYSSMVGR